MADDNDGLMGDGLGHEDATVEAPVLTSLLRLASPPCGGYVLAEFHFDGNTVLKVPISAEAAEALHSALGIWLASAGAARPVTH
jgi:hypothetical protein